MGRTPTMSLLVLALAVFTCPFIFGQEPDQETLKTVSDTAKGLRDYPKNWKIWVLGEQDWSRAIQLSRQRGTTRTAFTILRKRLTVVRAAFVQEAPPWELRFTLAHEAGHILCNCGDESRADKIADTLIKASEKK